jgi:hypothetical protein
MGWRFYDEAIDMMQRRFGYYPHLFFWRGRAYEVDSIDRCWEVRRRGRRAARRYFCVQAGGATFELYRDLEAGTWHLRRARWHRAVVDTGRLVLPTRLARALSEPAGAGSRAVGP